MVSNLLSSPGKTANTCTSQNIIIYYSFNNLRRQDNRRVKPELIKKKKKKKDSHLIVVVRNIAEEVPRFGYFRKNIVLIPVQSES